MGYLDFCRISIGQFWHRMYISHIENFLNRKKINTAPFIYYILILKIFINIANTTFSSTRKTIV